MNVYYATGTKIAPPYNRARNFDLSREKKKRRVAIFSPSRPYAVKFSSRRRGTARLPSSTRYINNELSSATSRASPSAQGNLPAGLILVASPVPRDLELGSHVVDDVAAGLGYVVAGLDLKILEFRLRGVRPTGRTGKPVCNDLPRDTCGTTMLQVGIPSSRGQHGRFRAPGRTQVCVRPGTRVSRNVGETPCYRSHP